MLIIASIFIINIKYINDKPSSQPEISEDEEDKFDNSEIDDDQNKVDDNKNEVANNEILIEDKYKVTCPTQNCKIAEGTDEIEAATGVEEINLSMINQDIVVLEDDNNKIYLIDYKKNEIIEEFENIECVSRGHFETPITGLVLKDASGKYGFYNYKLKKFTIPFDYYTFPLDTLAGDVEAPALESIFAKSLIVKKDDKYGIVDFTTGTTLLEAKYDEIYCYDDEINPNKYCITKENNKYKIIYYNNENVIVFDKQFPKILSGIKMYNHYAKNNHLDWDEYESLAYTIVEENNQLKLIELPTFKEIIAWNKELGLNDFLINNDEGTNDYGYVIVELSDSKNKENYYCYDPMIKKLYKKQ